jgi:F0F1-type ATP synthase epsilon subunit
MPDKLRKNPDLVLTVKSRKDTLFSGNVYSITSINELGFFDILPYHTNFVTLIKDVVVIDKGLPTEKDIKLDKGVLTVISNNIKIYVGI